MALIVKDRVKQSAAAPGTGTITLGSTPTGFQSFAAVGDTNTTYFAIVDPVSGAWEVNYGVYTSSGTTLTRNATPLSSSNAGALVNFTGAVDVFVTYPSEKAVYEDTAGVVTFTDNPILSAGTANGVLYLNGSKVATSGSALTFDGTTLGLGNSPTAYKFEITTSGNNGLKLNAGTASADQLYFGNTGGVPAIGTLTSSALTFIYGGAEQMRLTSTSLYTASGINVGFGTSSTTSYKLNVLAAFSSGIGGAYIEAGEFNQSALIVNHTNAAVAVPLFQVQKSGTGVLTLTSSGTLQKSGTNGVMQLMDGNTAGGVKIGAYTANLLANGYLAFEGYSTEYGRFDASGNFLIGATTSGGVLTLKNNPNASSENVILAIQANGAGTTTVGKLTYNQGNDTMRLFNTSSFAGAALIFSANNTDALYLTPTSLYTASGINVAVGTSTATNARLYVEGVSASSTPTIATFTGGFSSAVTSFSALAGLQLFSYQSVSGGPFTKTSAIIANGDGTVPSQLQFWTKTDGQSSPALRATIDSSGNVVIGDTTAGARLSVVKAITGGNIGTSFQQELVNNDSLAIGNWTGTVYRWLPNNANTNQAYIGAVLTNVNVDTLSDLVFGVKNTNAGNTIVEAMRIKTGNVVIGSTDPDPLSLARDRNLAIVTTGTVAALTIVGGNNARIDFGVGSTRTAGIYSDVGNFLEIFTTPALPIVFSPNSTASMRITAAGNLLVGGTSQTAGGEKFLVQNFVDVNSAVAVGIYAGAVGNKDINFYSNGNSQFFTAARIRVKSQAYTDEGNMSFWTTSNNGANVLTDSQKMVILANGNVGINQTVPDFKLDIDSGSANGSGVVTTLRLKNPGTTFGDGARLLFTAGDSTTGGAAIAGYGVALNSADLLFYAGGNTERARFNSTGAFVLAGGTTTANGIGITFPATASLSSNTNTLDDYEEGTWFPNQGSGLTVVGTFESVGYYTKIGNIVTITGYVRGLTNISCAAAGIICTNAPFPGGVGGIFWAGAAMNWNADSGSVCGVQQATTNIYSASIITASDRISFTITYQAG